MRKNVEARETEEQPIRPIRQRSIDQLAKETMTMLAREKVFPKRVRWQYAEAISRLVNTADSLSNVADGINPTNRGEYAIRHLLNVLTVAVLSALDAKVTQAMRVMGVNADNFDHWTKLYKTARGSMYRQINRDKKRYIPLYGDPGIDGISPVLNLLLKLLGTSSI